jgi:hypothetical protein
LCDESKLDEAVVRVDLPDDGLAVFFAFVMQVLVDLTKEWV